MTKKSPTAIVCLSPFFGGMEMDAYRYARMLAGSMQTVFIAKLDTRLAEKYKTQCATDNIQFEQIAFRGKLSLALILNMRRLIRKYHIRNVIFFGAWEIRSLYFAFLGMDINFIIRHGTTKTRRKKDPLHRLFYSRVNWHIPLCKHIARNVEYIIPFGKYTQMKVIYPSLRNHHHTKIKSHQTVETLRLLNVARVTEGKGQIAAIKACQALYDNNIPFSLTCVGDIDAKYYVQIQQVVADLPYREQLCFAGYSDHVADYYNAADIFIFPSKGEGLSSSFIEALGHGLICIAYNNTSFPELQELGFDFLMAGDGNLDSLKITLLDASRRFKQEGARITNNTQRVDSIFSLKRELGDLYTILE